MRLAPSLASPWWHLAFWEAVSADNIDLGRAVWLLGAHRSALINSADDIEQGLNDLDELAASRQRGSFEAWQRLLFVDLGLTGNGIDYHDVRNSFLPDVLVRRVGIPISLAVIGMEIGRRLGLDIDGIGLPGHFLLAIRSGSETRFIDAFNGGTAMDIGDVAARFSSMFGDGQPFHPSYLAPSTSTQIIVRMLANLKQNYARQRDLAGLRDVLRLRSCLPETSITEVRELARLHQAAGDLGEALRILDHGELAHPAAAAIFDTERARVLAQLN